MKYFFTTFLFLFLIGALKAQTPPSFVLRGYSSDMVQFTEDNIYFNGYSGLVKTDYSGNVVWLKQYCGSRFIVQDNAIYLLNSRSIVKLDTAGNNIWVKEIPFLVCPMWSDTSFVWDVIVDHDRMYLSTMQCPPFTSSDHCKLSLITLDTAGVVLDAWCDDRGTYWIYNIGHGVPSLHRGAFLVWNKTSGIYDQSIVTKLDSNGNHDSQFQDHEYMNSSYNMIDGILTFPDSTYLVINNASGTPGSFFAKVVCSKMDDTGNLIWNRELTTGPGMSSFVQVYLAAIDSSNEIYMLGITDSLCPSIIKMDSAGNILFVKKWFYESPTLGALRFAEHGLNQMHYKNGNLYCYAHYGTQNESAIMVLDTGLVLSCFKPDISYNVSSNATPDLPDSIVQLPHISVSLTPDSLPAGLGPATFVTNLCNLVQVPLLNEIKMDMNIWPNPFMNDLHLNHQIHEDKRATPLNIEIYNSIGSLFLKQTVVQADDIILHLEELPNGYYVLKCSDDRNLFVSPIVKQNFGFE